MAKMWAGRFKKELDESVNAFNSSISFDKRMYRADIEGSIAHSAMLAKQGIITTDDMIEMHTGLQSILEDIESGELQFDMSAEDIHMFIESELTARIGDCGKRLHTARSRNDQVALDIRLYLRQEVGIIIDSINSLIATLVSIAEQHLDTIMPGYTHMQRAQPITFAHHLSAYIEMLIRDVARANNAVINMNYLPLGAGALATTTHPIDRFYVASLLEFDGVCANSLDAVSDRDFCIEIASMLSIMMMHLSRLSEEVIMWATHEFKYIELDDAYSTGSSIMPQKKNPDITELVRGKSGRVFGDLMTLLTVMKGLPLAYNKDMQEDKEAIFDAIDTAKLCLNTINPMLATMRVNTSRMLDCSKLGFINATDCADYLAKKGLPFRDAYKITGELVALAIDNNCGLDELTMPQYKSLSSLFEEDLYEAIALTTCLNKRNVYGGPAPQVVAARLAEVKALLSN